MRNGTPFTVEKISPGAGMESGSGKGSCCYTDDHIALRPYLHGQNKMQQRMYRLRTVSDKSLVERMGELNQFLLDRNPGYLLLQWFKTFG